MAQEGMTAQGRYESLSTHREPYLRRARQVAAVTIPALVPPEGTTGATDLPTPWQSVGARGINNLASKLLLALFPPGAAWFRLPLDDFLVRELQAMSADAQAAEDARAEFEEALGRVERSVVNRMETNGSRSTLHEGMKHLLVAGNVLVQIMQRGRMRLHRLTNYVVKRDRAGEVLEIVVKETLARMTLPEEIRQIVEAKSDAEPKDGSADSTVDVFTRISRTATGWEAHQEVEGEKIPGSEATYPKEKLPWLALRWSAVDGEDYGRGMGEEMLGDLLSLEGLSQAIVELAAQAAKVLWLVNESGVTSKQKVANAPSGAVIDGDASDITILALEKFHDFTVVRATADKIEERLEQAFLLMSSIQRSGERVTAEEIRRLASELEDALGGIYSTLAGELQRPLASVLMAQMQREGSLPRLPEKVVAPKIVTGLEALGRNHDLFKLDSLVAGVAQTFGPEAVAQYINPGAYIKRRAAALGIDLGGMVRSDEEVAAMNRGQMMQDLTGKLGPEALRFLQQRMQAGEQTTEGGQ